MSLLVQNLGREDVHRNIKPNILSAFGDVALVVGDHFEKYLEAVLRVLNQAMQLSVMSATSGGPGAGFGLGAKAGGEADTLCAA